MDSNNKEIPTEINTAEPEIVQNGKIEEISDLNEEKVVKDEWVDLLGSGSIMKKILQEGKPDTKPQRLQKCFVSYKCMLEDDTLVDSVENLEIYVGDCDVIQGLDVAIALMNINEKCLLKIAPRLAYGKKGLPDKVPGDATIVYEVELLSVDIEDEPENLPIKERKWLGNKKRERGNWWYCRGENNLAIQCYRRALNYLDEVEGGITEPTASGEIDVTDADLQSLLEDRVSVCNNMAAAQIKLESYDAALLSLNTVLRCQPNNVKALFRKAKVHRGKNDLTSAMKCLQKAKENAPNDQDIQREINSVNLLMQKQKGVEKELAKRMFGATKKAENAKQTTSNKVRGVFLTVGAALVGLAGATIAYRFKYA